MAEIFLKRTLAGLAADDAEALDYLRKIPLGVTLCCKVRKARSVPQLRYYWAMCALVASNHATLKTREQVSDAIKLETGHVEQLKYAGKIFEVPASIAFEKLEQDQWRDFLMRARDAVLQTLLPGVELSDVEEEIARMVA